MTPFTDKQLNKLKSLCDHYGPMEQGIALIPHEVVSLIDRLEAAEACIIPEELIGSREEKYEAWRKAAGKDKPSMTPFTNDHLMTWRWFHDCFVYLLHQALSGHKVWLNCNYEPPKPMCKECDK